MPPTTRSQAIDQLHAFVLRRAQLIHSTPPVWPTDNDGQHVDEALQTLWDGNQRHRVKILGFSRQHDGRFVWHDPSAYWDKCAQSHASHQRVQKQRQAKASDEEKLYKEQLLKAQSDPRTGESIRCMATVHETSGPPFVLPELCDESRTVFRNGAGHIWIDTEPGDPAESATRYELHRFIAKHWLKWNDATEESLLAAGRHADADRLHRILMKYGSAPTPRPAKFRGVSSPGRSHDDRLDDNAAESVPETEAERRHKFERHTLDALVALSVQPTPNRPAKSRGHFNQAMQQTAQRDDFIHKDFWNVDELALFEGVLASTIRKRVSAHRRKHGADPIWVRRFPGRQRGFVIRSSTYLSELRARLAK